MPKLGGHPDCQLLPWAKEHLLSAACCKVLAHALPHACQIVLARTQYLKTCKGGAWVAPHLWGPKTRLQRLVH